MPVFRQRNPELPAHFILLMETRDGMELRRHICYRIARGIGVLCFSFGYTVAGCGRLSRWNRRLNLNLFLPPPSEVIPEYRKTCNQSEYKCQRSTQAKLSFSASGLLPLNFLRRLCLHIRKVIESYCAERFSPAPCRSPMYFASVPASLWSLHHVLVGSPISACLRP